jgi:outer membrane protein OmpA-like peptidoglycan-associated protein
MLEPNILSNQQEAQWISLSDLMTGLMMIFLLISVAFMMKIEADTDQLSVYTKKLKNIVTTYNTVRKDLYFDLYHEFKNDLQRWGADINKEDLSVRFKEPEILFKTGKSELNSKFKNILQEFFPRYLNIINSTKYKDSIKEIRIEGHTSSIWNHSLDTEDAYFKNMELSQARTRTTLHFILTLPKVQSELSWLKENMTANGLSSSKLIRNEDGSENIQLSQRVEFRIRTDAEKQMANILD